MGLRRRELYLNSVVGHRPQRFGGVSGGGSSAPSVTTFSAAGSGNYVAKRTGSLKIIGVGGGSCGGAGGASLGGGGGGGGAGAIVTVACAVGDSFAYVVGAGGASLASATGTDTTVANPSSANILTAKAGTAGLLAVGGTGGLSASCVGDSKVAGGNGFTTITSAGGGGGGPAQAINPLVAGTTATGTPGGSPGGGAGGASTLTGSTGTLPGAGAGGDGMSFSATVAPASDGILIFILD